MVVSLVLLAFFLGSWLKDSYDRSSLVIQEKNTLLFSQAVRKAEDSLLVWRFNFPDVSNRDGDTMVQIFIELDSLESGTFSSGKELHEIKPTGKEQQVVGIRKEFSFISGPGKGPDLNSELVSSASVIVHAIRGSEIDTAQIDTFLYSQIEKNYSLAKDAAFPGIGFGMVRLSDSAGTGFDAWMTPVFNDPVGNVRYAAVLDVGFWDVFKNILPQFFFSLFLLGITSAAFWVIHRQMRKQLQLAQLKDDFISNMTHELKTPISTVRVALEAMENFNVLGDSKKTEEYLEISKNEVNRLQLLVDRVMQQGALGAGDFRLEQEPVDLQDITEKVISALQVVLDQKNMQVVLSMEGRGRTLGDPMHLSNVLFNLVDNAIKFGTQGQTVRIRVREKEKIVTWEISDEGRGIQKEELPHIFEKFYRAPQGNVHNVKGHGLGLYYVDRMIKLHHGTIQVQSKPGEGTRFLISLPKEN